MWIPAVDVLQLFLKLAQDFGRRGPLHVSAVILHGFHVSEATVDLADVGLDLVTPVRLQDDEGGTHPPVTHSGKGAPPNLNTQKHEIN